MDLQNSLFTFQDRLQDITDLFLWMQQNQFLSSKADWWGFFTSFEEYFAFSTKSKQVICGEGDELRLNVQRLSRVTATLDMKLQTVSITLF